MVRPSRLALLLVSALLFFSMQIVAATGTSSQGSAGTGAGTAAQLGQESRIGSLDVILLLDKSLSMAPYFMEAKEYVAGQVLGPILVPGDRLIVELVYGKIKRLVTMDITSEADKAKAIRAIRSVKADGRFTDLGVALDAAKKDLDELGKPERPKYVLMISDERQEAPAGSPYQAKNYRLQHPYLEYVKKVDLGEFRAITVGLQVKDKVAQASPEVMKLLLEPPVRDGSFKTGAAASGSGGDGTEAPGSAAAARAAISAIPSWALLGAVGLFVLAAVGVALALILAKKNKKGNTEA